VKPEGFFAILRDSISRMAGRGTPAPAPGSGAFVADAHTLMIEQEPARARLVLKAFWVILVVALLWAAFTRVDEVTRGDGRVVSSTQLQVLQSLDGGVVSEILVKEGQLVEAGQVLLNIDPTRFDSSLQENRAQYLALLARAARLKALAEGTDFVPPPEVVAESPRTAEGERNSFEAARSAVRSQTSIAEQQLAQKQQELAEAKVRQAQASQAYDLTAKELAYTRPLIASGAVSEVDILRLERDASRYKGERDVAGAQIFKAQSAIGEASRKIQEVTLSFRSEARKELSETTAKLNVSSAGSAGLADKVAKSSMKAPVKGTVKRLLVKTVGGVVQPGKDVVEIVPYEEALLLDARVMAKDIAFLRPGDKAIVKFTAYDFSVYGGLDAKVELIGADSVADERGNVFYMVRLRTEKSQLGLNMPIISGMVAEVSILTGKKSILSYLLKPVLKARHEAFTER
jgi:adhesin transport system membrane fusion protein